MQKRPVFVQVLGGTSMVAFSFLLKRPFARDARKSEPLEEGSEMTFVVISFILVISSRSFTRPLFMERNNQDQFTQRAYGKYIEIWSFQTRFSR